MIKKTEKKDRYQWANYISELSKDALKNLISGLEGNISLKINVVRNTAYLKFAKECLGNKKMTFEIIPIEQIHAYSCKSLYSPAFIEYDEYLSKMVKDVNQLPPIEIIKLSDNNYSLSNGYHRFSVFKYLNRKNIKCEVF